MYLRMWPQVDVVFWHKSFPVVELSCVPVRIILHVGDLGARTPHTHTHTHTNEISLLMMLTQAITSGWKATFISLRPRLCISLLAGPLFFHYPVQWLSFIFARTEGPKHTRLLARSKCHVKPNINMHALTHTFLSDAEEEQKGQTGHARWLPLTDGRQVFNCEGHTVTWCAPQCSSFNIHICTHSCFVALFFSSVAIFQWVS